MSIKKTWKRSLLALIMSVILCLPFCTAFAAEAEMEGIDVSDWQGEIDFEQVRNTGIEIVYIRAAYGDSYEDPRFATNYQNAIKAGLKVGAYHYVTAKSVEEAQAQAHYFLSLLKGKTFACRAALDFEDISGLSPEEGSAIALAYLRVLEEGLSYTPLFYTDAYNTENYWQESLSRYPLWVANYGRDEPYTTGIWNNWQGFQYGTGEIAGMTGRVDRDRFLSGVLIDSDSPTPVNPSYTLYTVKRGDTLWGIAQKYGTTVSALVSLNHIANPNLIWIGQELKVPFQETEPSTPLPTPEYRLYTVKRGDTLWGIAQKYGTTVSALVSLNHIANPNLIWIGQVLNIPQ